MWKQMRQKRTFLRTLHFGIITLIIFSVFALLTNLAAASYNLPPVAVDNSYTINEDLTLAVATPGVLGNDTDADGDKLTAEVISGPINKKFFHLNADGSFIYTPKDDYNDGDSFTYQAYDGTAYSDEPATVYITITAVNDAPVANDDEYYTDEETTLLTVVTLDGVLDNDEDVDGDSLTAVLISGPYNGDLVGGLNPLGSFTYTPDDDFNGMDVFIYKADDGTAADEATVIIAVNPINDAPEVGNIPGETILEGGTFAAFDLDDYVTDVDNTNAQIDWTYSGNTDLTVAIDASRVATISTPDINWNGAETITFTATDPGLLFDFDPATFTVISINDPPEVSDIPDQEIAQGGSFATFDLDDYVDDIDNTDAEITWTYSGNTDLSVTIDASRVATIDIPSADWNGDETITFTAEDLEPLSDSDPAKFTVKPVNDPPVADPIPDQTVYEGEVVTFTGSGDDPDGDSITYHWEFGDGSPEAEGQTTTHTYEVPVGYPYIEYLVKFWVVDEHGAKSIIKETATVTVLTVGTMVNLEESGGKNTSAWAEHTIFVLSKDGNIEVDDKHGTPGKLTLYGKVENIGTVPLQGGSYRVTWEIYDSNDYNVMTCVQWGAEGLWPGDVCQPLTWDINFASGQMPLAEGKYTVRAEAWYFGLPGEKIKEFRFTIKQ